MAGKITIEELDSTLKSTINNKVDNSTLTTQLNNKINTSAIKNDLTSGGASNVLSAAQGVVLKGLVDSKADSATVTQQLGTKINTSAIKNDLTTGGASNVLSAEQGKTLKGLIDSLTTKVNAKADTTAVTQSANGLMTAADKKKLDGIATGANKYTHPSTHAASMITEDSTHRFLTDNERALIQAWETFKTNGGNIGGPLLTNRVERVISSNTIEHGYGFGLAIKSADGSDKLEIVIGNNANKKGLYPVQRMYLGTPEFAFDEIWAGDFSKQTNGYTMLPNGFILQWGRVSIATGNSATVTLPTVFPNALLTVQATGEYGNTDRYTLTIGNVGKNSLSIYKRTFSSGTSTDFCYWMALGY